MHDAVLQGFAFFRLVCSHRCLCGLGKCGHEDLVVRKSFWREFIDPAVQLVQILPNFLPPLLAPAVQKRRGDQGKRTAAGAAHH
jgi:hypothetical protein